MGFVKSMPKTLSILLAGVCLFLLSWSAPNTASAVDYYVSTSGFDEGDGSSGDPWKTLHFAITEINDGDTLNVGSGTYNIVDNGEDDEELILSQSNVTILGASGGAPVLDGTNVSTPNWTIGIEITGSNVTLKNLYVTGFSNTGIKSYTGSENTVENCKVYGNDNAIRVFESNNCTIKACEIYNNASDGISIEDSTGGTITENTIRDNVGTNSDGIKIDGCDPEVSRNKLYDNRFNISVNAASPTIKNNLIYQVTSGSERVSYGISIGGGGTVSPQIHHNTIDGGLYNGIHINGSGNTPDIKYNIITNFGQYGIENWGSVGNPVIDYNDVWNNNNENYSGCAAGDHDISQDPKYGSYTLLGTSPCINAIPIEVPTIDPVTDDIDGTDRPYGSGYDMGCYEDTTLPAVTTTTASSISSTTASSGGNVTPGGSSSVTARGVCWNTSANPTTSDSKTTDGSGTGSYTSSIMGLSTSTTYHIRAYATNTAGTAYGSDKTFTTSGPLSAGTYYVDVQNGNDSNDGTQANPWKTLHHAISEINGGGSGTYVLIMEAGTYSTGNGEADTAITLSQSYVTIVGADDLSVGASNISTFIDGTGAATWTVGIQITDSAVSNVTIKHLTIRNFSDSSGSGIYISDGSENEVLHCKVHDNTRGIEISSSSDCNVKHCEIYNNTYGLYIYLSTGEIFHNIIYDNTSIGVFAANCSPEIKRNKIYDNNTGVQVESNNSNRPAFLPHRQ